MCCLAKPQVYIALKTGRKLKKQQIPITLAQTKQNSQRPCSNADFQIPFDKKIVSETSVSYTIHFASRDFMRNTRTRVSQAYDGALHQSVISIFRDPLGLNSRKSLTYEETRNSDKVVIPNLRPFDAINLISDKAVSKNSESAGYYFYETTKGFHFRSYESMLTLQGKFARNELITLRYSPTANVMHNKKVEDNI